MTTITHDDVFASATQLGPAIRAAADTAERDRRVPKHIIEAMANAGVFRVCIPRVAGGLEQPLADSMRVIEELSRADGSTGWVATILASNPIISRQLEDDAVQEIFGAPDTATAGIVAPMGRADVVDGGFRVTGRWPFGSGCQEAAWIGGGGIVWEHGDMRMLPIGMPDWRFFMFPASDVEIIDTWYVSGLRATGSHDIAVKDVFVPANRVMSVVEDEPTRPGALYAFPLLSYFGAAVATVALGIAQRAIEEITELAKTRVPAGSMTPLAEQALGQRGIAEAAAELAAGRAFLYQTVAETWEAAESGALTIEHRGRGRMAATQAVTCAARAVDATYNLGGAGAIRDSSALQRCFRDVHAITQHFIVAPSNFEIAGRIMLGQDTAGMLV